MPDPTRAKLLPVSGPTDQGNPSQAVDVQFNPDSLKVSLANSLSANDKSKNGNAAQYLDKSAGTLTVELVFDTSAEGTDVRRRTGVLYERFMQPVEEGSKLKAPSRCLFQWGAFEFVGLMLSMDETLDFFSSTGLPLRATVSLKLQQDRYQPRAGSADAPGAGADPTFADVSTQAPDWSPPVPSTDWRSTAAFNGLESPRDAMGQGLSLPGVQPTAALGGKLGLSVKAGAAVGGAGFSFGASGAIGTGIAGAFSTAGLSAGAGANLSAGIGGGLSGSASIDARASLTGQLSAAAGLGAGLSAGASAGLGAGAGAGLGGSLGAGLTAGAGASASAGAAFGASADASLGASGGASAGASAGADLRASASTSVGFD
ncbi:hypothetical protein [uncultured Thiohalocapsa sp.]|uniref:CIS tube protein n=1 Tax=uncultured Thiohalocapsa sp. TaxID=768990 RepID=UPI0025E90357|nr:hypothetical protein [uncultured Thiohalocapsa sp.]